MDAPDQIAIIGFGFRAPDGAHRDLLSYLSAAKCAWSSIPRERFDQNAFYHPDSQKTGALSIRGGHFLQDDVFAFDAPFFSISPQEAKIMDPQHRMLLECAYEAIEQSGTLLSNLAAAKVGVFAAGSRSDYEHFLYRDPAMMPALAALGATMSMFANRLSYCFDFKGPSVTIDTACSSSITALHLACESLKRGECSAAFVGASSLVLSPEWLIAMNTLGAMGPDGHCYSYDARGNGYGRGEGAACLLLKPLSAALAAGDPIRAVIRNTAINQDGHTKGITLPSGTAQIDLLRRLYREAQLNPADTPYVEGHGTGTSVGDPIEANAISEVFGPGRTSDHPLYVGSVKSNFGHLENASGLLSVIKVVLMLESGTILPNADFRSIHPDISSNGVLQIPQRPMPWPMRSPKRVCLNNFGYGGSNASAIIDASPSAIANGLDPSVKENAHSALKQTNGINGCHTPQESPHTQHLHLVVLSAKSEASLKLHLTSLGEYIEAQEKNQSPERLLNDLAYTLGEHRNHYAYRWAAAADCCGNLAKELTSHDPSVAKTLSGTARIAFVFTGQGSQYPRMAVELNSYRVFRGVMRASSEVLKQLGAGWNLQGRLATRGSYEIMLMFAPEELERATDESRVNEAAISQPACTAIQIALVDLLKSWGIVPERVTGHSSGEIAAAYAAGVLTLETALAIAYYRGVAAKAIEMDPGQSGAMLAVGAGPLQAEELVDDIDPDCGEACVAAVNSPQSVTLSGDATAIDEAHNAADDLGLFARKLKVHVAYHSQHMIAGAASYRKNIVPFCNSQHLSCEPATFKVEFYSSVTGSHKEIRSFDARYWVANLISRVQFDGAMQDMLLGGQKQHIAENSMHIVLEIGPHGALKSPIQQILKTMNSRSDPKLTIPKYYSILDRGKAADESAVTTAGHLFGHGVDVNLAAINRTHIKDVPSKLLTNLPPYSWNKTTSFAHIPRAVENFLRPRSPGNVLLGHTFDEGAGLGHTFRNVFTLDDLPWLRDHKIGGHVVFPFAAYLVMAIEALQIIDPSESMDSAVLVREMRIDQALWIFEPDTVQLRLTIQPYMIGPSLGSNKKWSFAICSWDGDSAWTQHTCGQIMFDDTSAVSHSSKRAYDLLTSSDAWQQDDVAKVYRTLDAASLEYGSSFQGMQQLWTRSATTAVSQNAVLDIATATEMCNDGLSTIHPATLDAFLHPLLSVWTDRSTSPRPYVPTFASQVRIKRGFCVDRGQRFRVAAERFTWKHDYAGETYASVIAFTEAEASNSVDDAVVEIDNLTLTPMANARKNDVQPIHALESYTMEHFELVDLLSRPQLELVLREDTAPAADVDIGLAAQQDQAAMHFLNEAADQLAQCADDAEAPGHLRRFALWARRLLKQNHQNDTPFTRSLKDLNQRESALRAFSSTSAASQSICEIGQRLPQILRREVEPLDVMVQDGLLARTYSEDESLKATYPAMAKFVTLLSKTNPMLKVLELGAGTGGATEHLLHAMTSNASNPPGFLHYTYTDISSGFFENARERFIRWSRQLQFAKLNVCEDPTSQGFQAASYDLIVAANILHATPNIGITLKNIYSLLKPGGKLLLQELTCPSPRYLAFTTLLDWWVYDDEFRSDDGPLLSVDSWNKALLQSGFTGVSTCGYDFPGSSQQCTAVITSSRAAAPEAVHAAIGQEVQVCTFQETTNDHLMSGFIDRLRESITSKTSVAKVSSTTTGTAESSSQLSNNIVIVVDNPMESVYTKMSASDLAAIKAIFAQAKRVLWIAPSSSYPSARPESQMCEGLIRTLNAEGAANNAITVQLASYGQATATSVAEILGYTLEYPDAGKEELEYIVKNDGSIRVPRMVRSQAALDAFNVELDIPTKQQQPLWQPGRPLELALDETSGLESLHWIDSKKMAERKLGDNDMLLATRAASLNFVDLLRLLGRVPWRKGVGLEGAGIVEKVGRNVTQYQPGQRVCYMNFGGSFATHTIVDSRLAAPVPEEVDFADAATRPVVLCTAIMGLEDLARLRSGESVLIHAATGGVGQYALQIALHVGATVFATAGTSKKRQFLHTEFGIPYEHIFSSRNADFAEAILALTDGHGVDVVLNSLAGELLQKSWSIVAEFGRFVEIGKMDLLNNNFLEMRQFVKNTAFFGLDLDDLSRTRPELASKALSRAMEMCFLGIVKPARPLTTYQASHVKDGFRELQKGTNMGKIALVLGKDDVVPVRCRKPFSGTEDVLLRPDASYVITGGTGGLGRSIVGWMVANGARHILLLSRSGSSHADFDAVRHNAAQVGAIVRATACDISNRSQVAAAIKDADDMPPVAGVIHGASVFNDTLFANASHADWEQICAPKVNGAWNLHYVLERSQLDFFVSLASFTGVLGNVGQAIYASTTSFLESFARYRRQMGLPAVTTDLCGISEVGYAAEKGFEEGTRNVAGYSVNEKELHILLKHAIMGDTSPLQHDGVNMTGYKVLPSSLEKGGAGTQPWVRHARARHLVRAAWAEAGTTEGIEGGSEQEKHQQPLSEKLAQASGDSAALPLLVTELSARVSSIMMIERDEITAERPLSEYGLDSLVSVELRNWIRQEAQADLPLTMILGSANLGVLAQEILRRRKEGS
ncbi:Highly reducing polyketide synthase PKS2 [Pseudocercospora fuligena]|uniref:Highly reducing polyketide synthase PKS2 n=1 Tax=Pseudocercospora fuligena TaxID=685502 RepID=A0A8H6RQ31_9PEZI|nr:Highly reducing polyketide synthase PKS2 [Pseudocercospora fuligena]